MSEREYEVRVPIRGYLSYAVTAGSAAEAARLIADGAVLSDADEQITWNGTPTARPYGEAVRRVGGRGVPVTTWRLDVREALVAAGLLRARDSEALPGVVFGSPLDPTDNERAGV